MIAALVHLCVGDFLTSCLPSLVSSLFVIFLNLVVAFSFLPREVPLGFVVLNSLSFCLSVKLLISALNLNKSLAVFLVEGFSLSSFKIYHVTAF